MLPLTPALVLIGMAVVSTGQEARVQRKKLATARAIALFGKSPEQDPTRALLDEKGLEYIAKARRLLLIAGRYRHREPTSGGPLARRGDVLREGYLENTLRDQEVLKRMLQGIWSEEGFEDVGHAAHEMRLRPPILWSPRIRSAIEEAISSGKKRILEDMASGAVPRSARSFIELEDYVSAPELYLSLPPDLFFSDSYRAAIWTASDGQADMIMTAPEDAHRTDSALLALGRIEATEHELDPDLVELGEWYTDTGVYLSTRQAGYDDLYEANNMVYDALDVWLASGAPDFPG